MELAMVELEHMYVVQIFLALSVAITELLDLLAQEDIFLVVVAELVSWFVPRDKVVAQEVERQG
tara:strand:+ start:322 stop:513 length:192 start_codon:yes stop_codon:yes gene_type:complete